MKSKIEVLSQWSKDLRSGKFTQYQAGWTNGTDLCCLGVLACTQNSLRPQELQLEGDTEGNGECPVNLGRGIFTMLSEPAEFHWLDFVAANDKYNMSFDEIADLIDIEIQELGGSNE